MQKLMRATITEGTGRKSFRSFTRKKFQDVIAGGKSGHLSGADPKGSYDWFIGYGERDSRKIAYAMLCINKEKWYVKSSRFAREALEHYFKEDTPKVVEQTKSINPAETS
jgi:beta-lactamase class D